MLDSLNEPLRFAKKRLRKKMRKPKVNADGPKNEESKFKTEYSSPRKMKIKTTSINKIK